MCDGMVFNVGRHNGTLGAICTGAENTTDTIQNPTIPDYVIVGNEQYPVIAIGNMAFATYFLGYPPDPYLKGRLKLPRNLKYIGGLAFHGQSLLSGDLDLPESLVELAGGCFDGCGFTGSLIIPNNVTKIGSGAFRYAKFDGHISIGNSVQYIGDEAFFGCNKIIKGTLRLPKTLTYLGENAFSASHFPVPEPVFDEIICEAINPPKSFSKEFFWDQYKKPLFVPAESVSSYEEAIGWQKFRQIYAFGEVPLYDVTLNHSLARLHLDETVQLKATIRPEENKYKSIRWKSDDNNIATVNEDGLVTAHSLGETVIRAWTVNDLMAWCYIRVEPINATEITLSAQDITLSVNQTFRLSATVRPENAVDKTVSWQSNNKAIVTVSEDGTVTAVSVGVANITASCGDVSATCKVRVNPVLATTVTINVPDTEVYVGDKVALNATIAPANTTDKTIKWTCSTPEIATIDAQSGELTALAPGEAKITATCGDISGTATVTVKPILATEVTINAQNLTLLVGQISKLTATVTPDNTTDKTVIWKSDNETIAKVEAGGTVTAVSVGVANITASCGEVSATCKVTVNPVTATTVTINVPDTEVYVGDKVTLSATVAPDNTTDKNITWSCSTPEIATIDAQSGELTALAPGEAKITATCGDISSTATVTVKPIIATELTLSAQDMTLLVGQTSKLTATVTPDKTTDKTMIWRSDNEAIAKVDTDGTVTAVSIGVANITASCGDVSATCKVTVNPVLATTVTINVPATEVYVGDKLTLTATVAPDNTTDKTVMWGSSTPDIASIDAETGELTALAPGVAKITATCGEVSASCEVTVNPVPASTVTIKVPDAEIYIGDKLTLTATVAPDNTTDKTVMWGCSTPDIVSIDAETGELTALASGVAKITATCGEVCGSATVTVKPVPATSVSLSAEDLTLMIGQSGRLTAKISPDNTTDPTIVWKSDNESVAIVSSNGLVTAISAGTASVTATCGSVTATCRVTVNARPETPRQYVRKGNGTSCTFVVMMNLTDEQLAKEGYNFAYGYTDIHGTDIIISTTGLRYCHTSAQIYNDSGNDFWVYAYWKKEDGSIVSSMRRHLDGHIDEEFEINALNEYLSRSVNYENPENWIQPTRNGAKICLTSNYNTGLYVHTMDGMTVLSKFYERGILVQEELISGQFVPGTYVVTVVSGEIKKSKKIIVR